jgi:hypothetical protein
MQAHERYDDSGGDGKILCSFKPDRQPFHGVSARPLRG